MAAGDLAGVPLAAVACGDFHSAALDEQGRVYTWGWGGSYFGGYGMLGHGIGRGKKTPGARRVARERGLRDQDDRRGEAHTLLLTDDDELLVCGAASTERVRHGSTNDLLCPSPSAFLAEVEVAEAWAGSAFNTRSRATARSGSGAERPGAARARRLAQHGRVLDGARAAAADRHRRRRQDRRRGLTHAAAISEDGALYHWGMKPYLEPQKMVFPDPDERAAAAVCGHNFSLVQTESGRVYSFGVGRTCCLGHGDKKKVMSPQPIQALSDFRVSAMFAGYHHVAVAIEEAVGESKAGPASTELEPRVAGPCGS